jgi:hypothetical protein
MKHDKQKNLIPSLFPEKLQWDRDNVFISLGKLYDFVTIECNNAIFWYYDKKKWKKRCGVLSRVLAILGGAIAGMVPIIIEIQKSTGCKYILSPGISTVSLVFVALFISLDKFGGWTSGWIRYVNTAQQLSQLQSNFRLKWQEQMISLFKAPDYIEVLKETVLLLENFLDSVHDVVRKETDLWVQEFKGVLHELEKGEKK